MKDTAMNDDPSKKRLGRGLAALIGEMDDPHQSRPGPAGAPDGRVPIELVGANPRNPRRDFSESELAELAASIREYGIVQPVLVRPDPDRAEHYEIIAGERRWRAAQRAGLADIPVIVREADDRAALELAIIENVQRSDLNALEEAQGYQQLIDDHAYTQAELAETIGKSRSHVANTLRLLKLPPDLQTMVTDGALSAGHARALITAHDPSSLAKRIVKSGLSVRQAEALAQAPPKPRGSEKATAPKDADTVALEKALADATGLKVNIRHSETGGSVSIAYKTLEQLDDLCRRLQKPA